MGSNAGTPDHNGTVGRAIQVAKSLTYKAGGVSIAANDELVRRIRRSIKSTQDGRVLPAANDFAGFFKLTHERRRYKDPVLVACSDGVGS